MTRLKTVFDDKSINCREIVDGVGIRVVSINSTYRDGGDVSPCDADRIAKVIARYVSSPQFIEALDRA
jgi:hypothetical protein